MTTARKFLAFPLAFLVSAGSALAGQERHVVSPADMAAAVAARSSAQDADRAAIREALARPEVRNVATSMGADLDRLNDVVATISGADLQQAASAARQINAQLVGGASTLVISTTTLIIILLVVILLIVAIK